MSVRSSLENLEKRLHRLDQMIGVLVDDDGIWRDESDQRASSAVSSSYHITDFEASESLAGEGDEEISSEGSDLSDIDPLDIVQPSIFTQEDGDGVVGLDYLQDDDDYEEEEENEDGDDVEEEEVNDQHDNYEDDNNEDEANQFRGMSAESPREFDPEINSYNRYMLTDDRISLVSGSLDEIMLEPDNGISEYGDNVLPQLNESATTETTGKGTHIPMLVCRSPSMSRPGSRTSARQSPAPHHTPHRRTLPPAPVLPSVPVLSPSAKADQYRVSARRSQEGNTSTMTDRKEQVIATVQPDKHTTRTQSDDLEMMDMGLSQSSKTELKQRYVSAVAERRQQDETLKSLQTEFNDLLVKYAQAENVIDELRLGARVNLFSSPHPGQVHGAISVSSSADGSSAQHTSTQSIGIGPDQTGAQITQESSQSWLTARLHQSSRPGSSDTRQQTTHTLNQATYQQGQLETVPYPGGALDEHTVDFGHTIESAMGTYQYQGMEQMNEMYETDGQLAVTGPGLDHVDYSAVAGESSRMALLAQAKSVDEQVDAFRNLMSSGELSLDEQNRALEFVKGHWEELQKSYHHTRDQRGRHFDPDSTVSGEVYRLNMQLDDLEQQVKKNRRQSRTLYGSPLRADHTIGIVPSSDTQVNQSSRYTRRPTSHSITSQESETDAEEAEFSRLLDEYRSVENSPAEAQAVLQSLADLYNSIPAHRRPIFPKDLKHLRSHVTVTANDQTSNHKAKCNGEGTPHLPDNEYPYSRIQDERDEIYGDVNNGAVAGGYDHEPGDSADENEDERKHRDHKSMNGSAHLENSRSPTLQKRNGTEMSTITPSSTRVHGNGLQMTRALGNGPQLGPSRDYMPGSARSNIARSPEARRTPAASRSGPTAGQSQWSQGQSTTQSRAEKNAMTKRDFRTSGNRPWKSAVDTPQVKTEQMPRSLGNGFSDDAEDGETSESDDTGSSVVERPRGIGFKGNKHGQASEEVLELKEEIQYLKTHLGLTPSAQAVNTTQDSVVLGPAQWAAPPYQHVPPSNYIAQTAFGTYPPDVYAAGSWAPVIQTAVYSGVNGPPVFEPTVYSGVTGAPAMSLNQVGAPNDYRYTNLPMNASHFTNTQQMHQLQDGVQMAVMSPGRTQNSRSKSLDRNSDEGRVAQSGMSLSVSHHDKRPASLGDSRQVQQQQSGITGKPFRNSNQGVANSHQGVNMSEHGYQDNVLGNGYQGDKVSLNGYQGDTVHENGYHRKKVSENGYQGVRVSGNSYQAMPISENSYQALPGYETVHHHLTQAAPQTAVHHEAGFYRSQLHSGKYAVPDAQVQGHKAHQQGRFGHSYMNTTVGPLSVPVPSVPQYSFAAAPQLITPQGGYTYTQEPQLILPSHIATGNLQELMDNMLGNAPNSVTTGGQYLYPSHAQGMALNQANSSYVIPLSNQSSPTAATMLNTAQASATVAVGKALNGPSAAYELRNDAGTRLQYVSPTSMPHTSKTGSLPPSLHPNMQYFNPYPTNDQNGQPVATGPQGPPLFNAQIIPTPETQGIVYPNIATFNQQPHYQYLAQTTPQNSVLHQSMSGGYRGFNLPLTNGTHQFIGNASSGYNLPHTNGAYRNSASGGYNLPLTNGANQYIGIGSTRFNLPLYQSAALQAAYPYVAQNVNFEPVSQPLNQSLPYSYASESEYGIAEQSLRTTGNLLKVRHYRKEQQETSDEYSDNDDLEFDSVLSTAKQLHSMSTKMKVSLEQTIIQAAA